MQEIKPLSESVCQGLTDAFRACGQAFIAFAESATRTTHILYKQQIGAAQFEFIKYQFKVLEANFLTRWFWRRKRDKAEEFYNQLVANYEKFIVATQEEGV